MCLAQVNARANQLAHHLIASGTGLGSAVGLLLEPSIDAIVAMMAVLKAGCCYLPLAQHRSDAALALIAEDASLAEVIAHRGLQARALQPLPWPPVLPLAPEGTPQAPRGCQVHRLADKLI